MKRSVILAVSLLLPHLGFALTLDELASTVYERSLIKVDTDGKRQALQFDKEAMAAHAPITLDGSVRSIRADSRAADGAEYGVMIGYALKNPRLREAQSAQFDAMAESLDGNRELNIGLIRVALKREYLLREISREAFAIATRKKTVAEEAYAIALKKHESGRISQMELVRFQTERSVAEKELRQTQMQMQRHEDALREEAMMDQEFAIDDLSFGYVDQADGDRQILIAPGLKRFSYAQRELERSIDVVRRSTVESVNVGVGMTQEPTQNSLDLRVSVPIQFGSRNEKKIAALMAQRSALIRQRELAEEKLRLALSYSLPRLLEIQHAIEESASVEKQHESLYRMAHKGFEGGVVSLFEYLETKNRFYAALRETIQLKEGYVEEVARMEEKMGGTWK